MTDRLGLTAARRWPRRLILAALFGGAFLIAFAPVSDGDIFWHLAAGREMVRLRGWLVTDPFTTSAAGRPWIDVHWLFQLAVFAIFQASGLLGVVVAKALLVAAGTVILARAAERSEGLLGAILCAIVLLAMVFLARHLLLVRPVIVTLLMLSLFFAALERCRAGTGRSLLVLPFLQIVWANCQGLAVLGPLLIATYLFAGLLASRVADGGRRSGRSPMLTLDARLPRRALLIALALCALALLATPYGWHALALPGGLFMRVIPRAQNIFSSQVAENVPPWMLDRTAPAESLHLSLVLGILALSLLLARHRLALSRLLVLLGLAGLALMANRNVLLLYWLVAPILAWTIAPAVRSVAARLAAAGVGELRVRRIAGVVVTVTLLGQGALAGVAASREGRVAVPVAFHFPVESARVLRRMRASGGVFAPDHCGGYLEWAVPGLRPYIDTRLILHSPDEYARYLELFDDPGKFDALADAQNFRYVVVTTSYPDRYLGLAQHLVSAPGWRVIYTDGSEILFARAGTAWDMGARETTNKILGDLATRFSDSPAQHDAARLNLARLLVVWGQTREAFAVLATLNSRAAAQMRARAYFAAGEAAAAESLARTLLGSNQDDVRSLALLAQISMVRGQRDAGTEWLRRALKIDPYDPESVTVLQRMESETAGSGAQR